MILDAEWDVVVVGGANMDYLARGPSLPKPGDTVQGTQFQQAPGGKGANQAVAAARLGAQVALVSRVGTDECGDIVLRRLVVEGVDTRFVLRDRHAPTGVAVIQVDARGEKQILTAVGANEWLAVGDVEAAASAIRNARVVLMQLEVPVNTVVMAARIGREAGAQLILDPAPPTALPDELFEILDVIRPNADEAEVLTGVKVTDRRTARDAASRLLARGVGAAVVQAGSEGDLVVWGDGEHWLPRILVESVDSTGAGDAFAGALAVMIAEGRPLVQATRFASAAAALTTTKLGAQAALPHRNEVFELIDRIEPERAESVMDPEEMEEQNEIRER
jgi:ribokinase